MSSGFYNLRIVTAKCAWGRDDEVVTLGTMIEFQCVTRSLYYDIPTEDIYNIFSYNLYHDGEEAFGLTKRLRALFLRHVRSFLFGTPVYVRGA